MPLEHDELHRDSIVIDGTSFFCRDADRLLAAGVTAINTTTAWPDDDFDVAVMRIEEYYALVRRDARLGIIEHVTDFDRLKRAGRAGIIVAFQNARPIGSRLERVEACWRLGVRTIQLTYNNRNLLGDGVDEASDAGLSKLGRALVREMNRVGIMVDLSHVGYRTSMDAIEVSEKPCVFTHSNPKALVNVPRNITDEQIRAVAKRGGVVGCSCFPPLVWKGEGPPTLDDFVNVIDYVVQMAGIDHVSIGSDSEATKGAYPVELRASLRRQFAGTTGTFNERFPQGQPVVGLEDGLGDWPKITRKLLDRGYQPGDVKKIIGGNLVRIFGEVWRSP